LKRTARVHLRLVLMKKKTREDFSQEEKSTSTFATEIWARRSGVILAGNFERPPAIWIFPISHFTVEKTSSGGATDKVVTKGVSKMRGNKDPLSSFLTGKLHSERRKKDLTSARRGLNYDNAREGGWKWRQSENP